MTRPVRLIGPLGADSYFGAKVEDRRKHARALNRMSRLVRSPKAYKRAAELIEGGYTKHTLAADKHGNSVDVMHPAAINFCAVGAMMRAGVELGILSNAQSTGGATLSTNQWTWAVKAITDAIGDKPNDGTYGHRSVNSWNNDKNTTGEDVAAALRAADPARIHNPLGGTPRYV